MKGREITFILFTHFLVSNVACLGLISFGFLVGLFGWLCVAVFVCCGCLWAWLRFGVLVLETNQVIGEKKSDLSSSKSKQYPRNLGPAMIISAQINGLWDRLAPALTTTQGPRFRQPLNILMHYFQCLLIFSIKKPTAEVLLPFQC